jgi:hypothetical protein
MANDIVKKDLRLFLFRTLEYGINNQLIDKSILEALKNEGVELSLGYAKKYYKVIYEAYLRQASYCVLGIMNLGLIQTSGGNFDEAVHLIQRKGFVGMFRQGWTRVIRLAKLAGDSEEYSTKTEFEWEKDFSESFSAVPGKRWIGNSEYIYNLSKLRNLVGE